MKKIAVVLSGCGFRDGTEITEAVSTLICLGEHKADVHCFAPSLEFSATNHLDGSSQTSRNTLEESARICRGKIQPLDKLHVDHFDAIIFPGGYGAALHLSNWASQGARANVLPEIKTIIEEFHKQSKPIGAICIAPTLVAKVLGQHDVVVTIGKDTGTIAEILKTGAQHETCAVDDYITDRANKVVTTPAYMYDDARPDLVFLGIQRMIKELVEMA